MEFTSMEELLERVVNETKRASVRLCWERYKEKGALERLWDVRQKLGLPQTQKEIQEIILVYVDENGGYKVLRFAPEQLQVSP
jgi:hypothetical protein